jgi:hypothetical protein
MRRREFIKATAAATWSPAVLAQQADQVRKFEVCKGYRPDCPAKLALPRRRDNRITAGTHWTKSISE